jgi:hypothetical protein
MIILVFICQTIVYREVTRLFTLMDSKPVEDRRKDPWSKTLNWYFFAVANYFLYGESIIYYFKVSITFRCQLPSPLITFNDSMLFLQTPISFLSLRIIGSSVLPFTRSVSWGSSCR